MSEQYKFDFDPALSRDDKNETNPQPEVSPDIPPETASDKIKPSEEINREPRQKTFLVYTTENEECVFIMNEADYTFDSKTSWINIRNRAYKEIKKQKLKGILDETKKIKEIDAKPKSNEPPQNPWWNDDSK